MEPTFTRGIWVDFESPVWNTLLGTPRPDFFTMNSLEVKVIIPLGDNQSGNRAALRYIAHILRKKRDLLEATVICFGRILDNAEKWDGGEKYSR